MDQVANVLGGLAHEINSLDGAEVVVLAGIITTSLHYLADHWRGFDKFKNVVVSFALPVGSAALTALLHNGAFVTRYPEIFLTTQLVYQVVEAIKRAALKQVQV